MSGLRLAYVLHWPHGPASGPAAKALTQVRAWNALGARARLFVGTTPKHAQEWRDEEGVELVATAPLSQPGVSAQLRTWAQERSIVLHVARRWRPDCIYHRQTMLYPGFRQIAREVPVVVELNGNDAVEMPLAAPRKAVLHRWTRDAFYRAPVGFVAVSHELATDPNFDRYGKPTVVIGNGIALDDHTSLPPTTAARPRLVFIGHDDLAWHGIDKLVRLADLAPECDFDLVGIRSRSPVSRLPNVRQHGELYGGDLGVVLAAADVGVATLALHRSGKNEASPLKSRTYLAHGLAVLHGYLDTDFPEGAPFLLRLPNEESNVDNCLPQIREFVARWHGRRVDRDKLRRLDVAAKESARLEFMSERTADFNRQRQKSR